MPMRGDTLLPGVIPAAFVTAALVAHYGCGAAGPDGLVVLSAASDAAAVGVDNASHAYELDVKRAILSRADKCPRTPPEALQVCRANVIADVVSETADHRAELRWLAMLQGTLADALEGARKCRKDGDAKCEAAQLELARAVLGRVQSALGRLPPPAPLPSAAPGASR